MSKPIWLEHALLDSGVKEIDGSGNNPRIVEMDSHTSLKAKEDSVPWCAAAVNCWLEECGITGTDSAAAKSFLTWGKELTVPREGCVVVIQQRSSGSDAATGSASGYHVALFVGQDAGHIYLYGGNQSDQCKQSSFPLAKYRICGYRWPEGVA